jgi:hypothetical protein
MECAISVPKGLLKVFAISTTFDENNVEVSQCRLPQIVYSSYFIVFITFLMIKHEFFERES